MLLYVIQNRSALRSMYNQFEVCYTRKLLYVYANMKCIYGIYLAMKILKQRACKFTTFRNTTF
jgi:hypothetical protein